MFLSIPQPLRKKGRNRGEREEEKRRKCGIRHHQCLPRETRGRARRGGEEEGRRQQGKTRRRETRIEISPTRQKTTLSGRYIAQERFIFSLVRLFLRLLFFLLCQQVHSSRRPPPQETLDVAPQKFPFPPTRRGEEQKSPLWRLSPLGLVCLCPEKTAAATTFLKKKPC